MSTSSNAIFNGNSRFATDFQTIIERSVAQASGPLNALQRQKTVLSNQSSALSSLDQKLTSLQTTLNALESSVDLGSYTSSSSNAANTTVLSASLSDGVIAGSYQIEATSLGSHSNAMSKDALPAVGDPSLGSVSSATSFTLTVNSVNYTLRPSAGTLSALVSSINGAGANVQATVVNVGSNSTPNYRLAIQSTRLGGDTIQINDGTQNLLNMQVTGAPATYKVNGGTTAVESDSRTVTLSSGLTVTLLKQSPAGDATTLTVSRSTTGMSSALSVLATNYNAVVDELATHRGKDAGALAGQSSIASIASALREITSYSDPSGQVKSLTDIGVTFDTYGHLSFDKSDFTSAVSDGLSGAEQFLGAIGSEGSGFLKAATDILTGLDDATTGLVKSDLQSVKSQITRQDQQIADAQERIDDLRIRLQTQMASADALIAGMEQRYSFISDMFASMKIASQSYG